MANSNESMQLNGLRPGVYSTINAAQDSYASSEGIITLFAADAFEKGVDGEIGFVSTPKEFIFKYGEPNYTKYGQTSYNILRWLENGGQAFVMRLLPDNATFAHAVVNVQTKVNTDAKKVLLDKTNEFVNLDNVFLRPTASFVKKNNINKEILVGELSKLRTDENTVDGYENNFIMMFYPEGRGESYNDLGFRIYPNPSYDSSKDSIIYNFEVIRYNDTGDMNVVEGPFYVSLDPDALSGSNESMYIESVVNRYSQYLNCVFNYDAFFRVAQKINPNVNPSNIDILTGKSPLGSDGKPKTYYNEKTRKDEDIHITLHKYNNNGKPVTINGQTTLNIPEVTDPVEKALVNLDNSLRENYYNTQRDNLNFMRQWFPRLDEDKFTPFKLALNKIFTPAAGDGEESGEIIDLIKENLDPSKGGAEESVFSKYLRIKAEYDKEPADSTLTLLNGTIDSIVSLVRSRLFNYSNDMSAAYNLTNKNSPNPQLSAKYQLDVNNINVQMNQRDKVSIFTVQHQKKITDIIELISNYELGLVEGSSIEGLVRILDAVESEIKYVYESLLPVAFGDYNKVPVKIMAEFDALDPKSIVSIYNANLQLLDDISSGYIESTAENRVKIYSASNDNVNRLLAIISSVTFKNGCETVEKVVELSKTTIIADVRSFHEAVLVMITPQGTYDVAAIIENARQMIDVANSEIVTTNSKFFNSSLLDFSSPIKLLLGSDGDFEFKSNNNAKRSASIKNHLIKAYGGLVNAGVSDRKLYPFDLILDSRYDNEVKVAISDFVRSTRQDCQFFADSVTSEFPVSPEDVLNWRNERFNISSNYVSVFSQDLTYYDAFTGKDIRFTPTYMLAQKIPMNATQYGLHYPIAGPRRGIVDGQKEITWFPNEAYSEKMYAAHINYIEYDNKITKIGTQSTTLQGNGPLTNINNMFTLLKIKRGADELCRNFIFEFNDEDTINSLYSTLNNYFSRYTSNRSCEEIVAEISASDYDKQQRILRVSVSIKFTGVIERIALSFNVK